MPKISVIVPVYNTEKYLHRCIDSILAQTFTDFELLLIDDGSKDNSGVICDEYAAKDSRVRVFHKENGGVSSARNQGLDNASGEWVFFVDSDDAIMDKTFEVVPKVSNVELIITSYIAQNNNGLNKYTISPRNVVVCETEKKTFIEKYINTNTIKAPWAKFFRRNIICDLRFDENISCGEDFLFVLTYLHKTFQIYLVNYCTYIYTIPEQHFHLRYQSTIKKSTYTLHKLFNAYKQLNLNLPEFECSLFYDYKSLCQKEIYKSPKAWYTDRIVCEIYSSIKKYLGVSYRMKYFIMSNKFIFPIILYAKKHLRHFGFNHYSSI